MKIPVNQANYPTSFFANNVNVDVPGKLGRDTNTKERDVINSLNSLGCCGEAEGPDTGYVL